MSNQIGKNIHALRKQQGLTQEELADSVKVSFQAVSKWENGNSLPDISVLPLLANVLHCSIDQLMGYAAEQKRITDYGVGSLCFFIFRTSTAVGIVDLLGIMSLLNISLIFGVSCRY